MSTRALIRVAKWLREQGHDAASVACAVRDCPDSPYSLDRGGGGRHTVEAQIQINAGREVIGPAARFPC